MFTHKMQSRGHKSQIDKVSFGLWLTVILLCAFLFTEPIAQPVSYHNFADNRPFMSIDNAANVLSNLLFIIAGIAGSAWLISDHQRSFTTKVIYAVFFVGLMLTGVGSSYYHLAPNNQTLVWDRLAMTICFSAFVAFVLHERVNRQLGEQLLPWLLTLGVLSVLYWDWSDDLRPYFLFQFGGLLILPIIIFCTRGQGTKWLWLALAGYALAKLAEVADQHLYQLTDHVVSGHTLKHIAAGLSGLMIALKIRFNPEYLPIPKLRNPPPLYKLAIFDLLLFLCSKHYSSFLTLLKMIKPDTLSRLSRQSAWRAWHRAYQRTPAYQQFIPGSEITTWQDLPTMDKQTYIQSYATKDRCIEGIIPTTATMIDESSGSTGTPFNWVRSARERAESHAFISFFTTYCFGAKPKLVINAFSMGAWATGLNMGISLERNGIVKNTGPDVDKILSTLLLFGPTYNYLITGYPPFLKHLQDEASKRGTPLKNYHIDALAGGEGMSEGLRDYLLCDYRQVYSGYGATDLEIGVAGETPMSVSIRKLARDNPSIRTDLFGSDSRLPMVFQYNPLMHYVETNSEGEIIVTINRSSVLSPRIRYNIHDQGGIAEFNEIKAKLKSHHVDLDKLNITTEGTVGLKLPFLWIFGRKDYTLSIMGANIYPEDLEQCIYANNALASITQSFCQSLEEGDTGDLKPAFFFEITVKPTQKLQELFFNNIVDHLTHINADYRKARQEYPDALTPSIYLHNVGEGPFQTDQGKIKQVRLVK